MEGLDISSEVKVRSLLTLVIELNMNHLFEYSCLDYAH